MIEVLTFKNCVSNAQKVSYILKGSVKKKIGKKNKTKQNKNSISSIHFFHKK